MRAYSPPWAYVLLRRRVLRHHTTRDKRKTMGTSCVLTRFGGKLHCQVNAKGAQRDAHCPLTFDVRRLTFDL